jgi:iron-sulfur cluster repair protein YtfE (RIC family)
LTKGLSTFGKSVLIAAGAGFAVVRGLRALNSAGDRADLTVVKARIDALSLAVARLGDQSEQLSARQEASVTRTELAETLDRVFAKFRNDVDERFERQTRSVEALRLMVGQTDELLQKVLDGLEVMQNEAAENDQDLSQTRR